MKKLFFFFFAGIFLTGCGSKKPEKIKIQNPPPKIFKTQKLPLKSPKIEKPPTQNPKTISANDFAPPPPGEAPPPF